MAGPDSAQAAQRALEGLHDVVQPPPVGLPPQTSGWYVLFALAGLALLWVSVILVRRRLRNRYRREAVRELCALEAAAGEGTGRTEALRALPILVRRTSLAAWPRVEVACLSGDDWLAFLDKSYGGEGFTKGPGRLVALAAYEPDGELQRVSDQDARAAFALAAEWIRRHRVRA